MTTLTLTDLAALTGYSYDWLSRKDNRARLYRRGCPRPLPCPGRPRWSRAAVEAWMNTGQTPSAPPDNITELRPAKNIEQLCAARQRLAKALNM